MKTLIAAIVLVVGLAPAAHAETWEWLSLGAKGPKNTITAISGVDTADARASARIE